MARLKIDYGIDLGTTNSAICRMEKGEPVIIKSDTLKDTMPSCVYFNKKKSDKAYLINYIGNYTLLNKNSSSRIYLTLEDEIVDIMYNNYEKDDLTQYNKNKHIEYMIYDEYTSTDSNVPENLKSLGIDFTYYKQLSGVNYNGRELKPMYSNLIKTNSTSQIYSFSKSQQGIFQEFIDSLTSIKLTDEEIDNFIEGLNLDINNYDKYEIAQQCVELTKDENTFFSVVNNIDIVEMDGNLTLKTLKHAIKQGIVGDKHRAVEDHCLPHIGFQFRVFPLLRVSDMHRGLGIAKRHPKPQKQ